MTKTERDILNYSMKDNNLNVKKEIKPRYIMKLCILGSGGVGKTCMCRRLCYDTFDAKTKLTIGIDFYTYDLPILINGDNNEESFIRLSIWDFGGQEQFRTFFPYYLGGANGILLVFSLLNISTLIALDYWYETLVKNNHKDTPKIFIGTKKDLLNLSEEKLRVDDLVINRFLKKHEERDFIKTSAKSNFNIEYSFKEIAKKVLNHHKFRFEKLV
ncbi:MAG: Rab family GTPase [Candidatus Hermodarchaeota archaeon]